MAKEEKTSSTNEKDELKKIQESTTKEQKKASKKKLKRKIRLKLYLSYATRMMFHIFFLVVFIVSFLLFLFLGFSITKTEIIKYREKSNINYQVYLKENDFYDIPYLEKGMAYVASLIDNVNIHYHYEFTIAKNLNFDVAYKVMGKLVIQSQNNANAFYEKTYDLTEEMRENIKNQKQYSIDKNIVIDYAYYNNLANKFKSNYAVNTSSYLEVYLEVAESANEYSLNNKSKTILIIPLSEQEINIRLENKDINEEQQILFPAKLKVRSYPFLLLSLLPFVLILITMKNLWELISFSIKRNSKYDRYVNRILRGYDRIIINVKTAPRLKNYNIIEVENFEELIDVRDNIKQPIRYLVITNHQKCEFFIIHNKDLYLYVVKSVDLEKDKKDEDA